MVSKTFTILVVYWKRVQGARERGKNAYEAACPITSILPGHRITHLAQSSLPAPPQIPTGLIITQGEGGGVCLSADHFS